jgi:hypothetical protein
MRNALIVIGIIAVGSFAGIASANKPDPHCSIAPNQVAVGQTYAVSASGLPNGGSLNMVVTYPNGNKVTSPITSTNGSYWGQAVAGTDAGTYTYAFVGKVSWPSGDSNKLYATCSMQVS